MNYKKIFLCTVLFFASSFIIRGLLSFVLAKDYFETITIFRDVVASGAARSTLLAMLPTVITGLVLAILYPLIKLKGSPIVRGLKFGLLMGLIVISTIALYIPARFDIPSIEKWILINGLLGMSHYLVSGMLIGLVYKKETADL